jgi:hypothetical protein
MNMSATAPPETSRARRAARWDGAAAALVAAVLLWSLLAPMPWAWIVTERTHVQVDDQVYHVTQREWRQAFEHSMSALSQGEQAALRVVEEELQRQVTKVFEMPRGNVTEVADWYYSMRGAGTRAGLAMMGWLPGSADGPTRVAAAIGEQMFPAAEWEAAHEQLLQRLTHTMAAQAEAALQDMRRVLHAELAPRRSESVPAQQAAMRSFDLDFDQSEVYRIVSNDPVLAQGGMAVSVSVLTTLAARRAAQAAATRVVSRSLAAQGSIACLATGPFAWVCTGGVFTGTLLVGEYAVLRIDEARNRDELEAAFRRDLERLERAFADGLHAVYVAGMVEEFAARRSVITARVRPIDLLLAPRGARQP